MSVPAEIGTHGEKKFSDSPHLHEVSSQKTATSLGITLGNMDVQALETAWALRKIVQFFAGGQQVQHPDRAPSVVDLLRLRC